MLPESSILLPSQGYRANSPAVDLYDSSTRIWSTGSPSQARGYITTATIGHKAIFAGGDLNRPLYSDAVDIFNAVTHRWSTAKLSVARDGMITATVSGEVVFAGASTLSDAVDISDDGDEGNVIDVFDTQKNSRTVQAFSGVPLFGRPARR